MGSEETKDVDPAVIESQLAADATVQQAVSQPDTGDAVIQPDTGAEEKTIPYDRFKEVNEAKNQAEAQLQAAQLTVQQQNMLLQQNQQPRQRPKTTYEQAVLEAGLQDESYLNQEQQAQVFARKDQLDNRRFQQEQANTQNNQFAATHDDYPQVVGTTDPMTGAFTPSPELRTLLTKKPYLLQAANSSGQAAYDLVMQERKLNEFEQNQTVTDEQNVRQTVDAKTQPMSPASSGGGGDSSNDASFNTREAVEKREAEIRAGKFD